MRQFVLILGAVLSANFLFPSMTLAAVGDVKDFTIHQPYVSPRALGMGNAFTAVADDHSTLFYNPAGLARLEEGQINLGIGAMIDSKVLKLKDDVDKVSGGDSSQEMQNMVSLLQDNFGNHYSSRLPTITAFWVRPKWGIAIIPADLSLDLEPHQLAMAALSVIATQDTTLAVGYGQDLKWFGKNRFSFGVTVKGVYRAYYNRSLLALDLISDKNLLRVEDAREGFTVDGDIGLLFSPERGRGFWRATIPTVGFTVRNVSDHGFPVNYHLIDKNSSDKPARLQRRFDVGTKWDLPDWWLWKTRFMIDQRDMGHENYSFQKGLHMGAEFLWKIRGWWQGGWRVGINQGYFTAGFTGKLAIFNLDLATYAEEVGPSDAPKANRRYVAKCSLDW